MVTTGFIFMMGFTVCLLMAIGSSVAFTECLDTDDRYINKVTGCLTRDIKMVMLSFPPYVILADDGHDEGIAIDYVIHSMEKCCGENVSLVQEHDLNATDYRDLPTSVLMDADIIFPVTDYLESELTFSNKSYTFYDLVTSQGYVLIGHVEYYNEKARTLVLGALLDSWPIFSLMLLLTGIAGIFVWALEPGSNEDFPVSFARGSYEGFWWAFITMTTVGYGDKTPRSISGRIFGILWILIGLVVITMFIATVTSALTHSSSVEFNNALEGQDVAVFRDSEAKAEAIYIGAITHEYDTFEAMQHALFNRSVEGIFMERFRASHYMKHAKDDNLRVFDAVHTRISYKMALKKNTTCYFLEKNKCFRRRVEYPLIKSDVKFYTAPLKVYHPAIDAEGLLSGRSPSTGVVLLIILGVLLVMVALGILGELIFKKSKSKRCKPTSQVLHDGRSNSSLLLDVTTKQLQGLEQYLEKLSTEIQNIRENLVTKSLKNNPDAVELTNVV